MKKGFILGMCVGLTVAGASLVFANSEIRAILNNKIKVTLNGITQTFRDETSNAVQYPITYENRTYLPLRTVANLVGVEVGYDEKTNTAILEAKESKYSVVERLVKEELKKWPGVKDVIVNDITIFTKESATTKIDGDKAEGYLEESLGNMPFYKRDVENGDIKENSIRGDVEYTLVFESIEARKEWEHWIAAYGPSHTYQNFAIRASGFGVSVDENGQYAISFGNC